MQVSTFQISLGTLIFLIVLALAFDFMNGFHDAANSIATVVSTGVLKPQQAVLFAAACNVSAYFFFHLKVAATVGKGTIDPVIVDQYIIFATLLSALVWNVVTWYYGIPSSSSHALIGGLVGAGLAKSGFSVLNLPGLLKIIAFIIISPLLGFFLGGLAMLVLAWICVRTPPHRVDERFRKLQLLSAGLYSLGHGGNDAQKTIGVVWMLLIAAQYVVPSAAEPPLWLPAICYIAIGLGTLCGGWRIVRTMGQRITNLRPFGGFCAELGGALTLFASSALGVPVSTTHTITGAIAGVGATRKFSTVRWGIARGIVVAWLITIPAAALLAAVAFVSARAVSVYL